MLDTLDGDRENADVEETGDGTFRLPDGLAFRLPVGRDECEVGLLPRDEARRQLVERCVLSDDGDLDVAEFEKTLEQLAPTLDLDLQACCAECGENQPVHFDVQNYSLGALLAERKRLMSQVHCLASAYGWGFNEILSLTRFERLTAVGLVEADIEKEKHY